MTFCSVQFQVVQLLLRTSGTGYIRCDGSRMKGADLRRIGVCRGLKWWSIFVWWRGAIFLLCLSGTIPKRRLSGCGLLTNVCRFCHWTLLLLPGKSKFFAVASASWSVCQERKWRLAGKAFLRRIGGLTSKHRRTVSFDDLFTSLPLQTAQISYNYICQNTASFSRDAVLPGGTKILHVPTSGLNELKADERRKLYARFLKSSRGRKNAWLFSVLFCTVIGVWPALLLHHCGHLPKPFGGVIMVQARLTFDLKVRSWNIVICQNFQRDEKLSGEPAVFFFQMVSVNNMNRLVTLPEI